MEQHRLSVASTATYSSMSPSITSVDDATYVVLTQQRPAGSLSAAPPGHQLRANTAVWGRKEQGKIVDLSTLVQGMREQHRIRAAEQEDDTERLRTQLAGFTASEGQEMRQRIGQTTYNDDGELPSAPPSDFKAGPKRRGHSRIRSLFSSPSNHSLKASISSPVLPTPPSRPSELLVIEQPQRNGQSHSASTHHNATTLPRSESTTSVKFVKQATPSGSRPSSSTSTNKLSRRPSLPTLRKTPNNPTAGISDSKTGWFSSSKSILRRSPSSSALAAALREPPPLPPSAPSASSARSSSPSTSLRYSPSTSSSIAGHEGYEVHDLTARATKSPRRPSVPETAFKAFTSFAMSRGSSHTGSSSSRGDLELSDQELRSWRVGASGTGEKGKEKQRQMEALQARESEEIETTVQRGPVVREDLALVDGSRRVSRESSRSTSPGLTRDMSSARSKDLSSRSSRCQFSVTSTSPIKSNPPPSTRNLHISDSLPDELALSFLAASGYLEQTVPAPPLPLPRSSSTIPAPTALTSPSRSRRTTYTRRPDVIKTAAPSLVTSRSFASEQSAPLLGGLQPPPRPSKSRQTRACLTTSTSAPSNILSTSAPESAADPDAPISSAPSTPVKRIISAAAWNQVSLSANRPRRRSSAKEGKQSRSDGGNVEESRLGPGDPALGEEKKAARAGCDIKDTSVVEPVSGAVEVGEHGKGEPAKSVPPPDQTHTQPTTPLSSPPSDTTRPTPAV